MTLKLDKLYEKIELSIFRISKIYEKISKLYEKKNCLKLELVKFGDLLENFCIIYFGNPRSPRNPGIFDLFFPPNQPCAHQ